MERRKWPRFGFVGEQSSALVRDHNVVSPCMLIDVSKEGLSVRISGAPEIDFNFSVRVGSSLVALELVWAVAVPDARGCWRWGLTTADSSVDLVRLFRDAGYLVGELIPEVEPWGPAIAVGM